MDRILVVKKIKTKTEPNQIGGRVDQILVEKIKTNYSNVY